MKTAKAEIIREYGPFPDVGQIHGVSFDGSKVWFATGHNMLALDPDSGEIARRLDFAGKAGTAFDGTHLFQIKDNRIHKLDPETGEVKHSIPCPSDGDTSGMAWAEGSLWLGQYKARKILQIDPDTGKVLRTIESNRFVTGVTWVAGELWHGTWEEDESCLRHIDAGSGEILEQIDMPSDVKVSGLESDGGDRFFCGGGPSGKIRAVRRGQ